MKVLITENGPILGTFDKTAEGDYFERSGMLGRPTFLARRGRGGCSHSGSG